jgi:hypothetical protein
MVPATSALLSLLALKWLDKERRSHISDFNFDEALGLFAGLNILPKTTFATDYSYRTPTVCPSVASRNLLLYQSLPISIPCRHANVRRRKDDPGVDTAARSVTA